MSAKIAAALHEVMSKVAYVQKTGKNAFHNYRYAGEADLLDKLRPAMIEAGLLLIPSVESVSAIDENGITTISMEYTLAHKDGDIWPHKIKAAGAGGDKNKNGVGDKGLYKAITGANKYLLFKLFQIETGDDPESSPAPNELKSVREPPAKLSNQNARNVFDRLQAEVRTCLSREQLNGWMAGNKELIRALPDDWQGEIRTQCEDQIATLKEKEAA